MRSALKTISLRKNLEDNADSLSGGEKQRLAFARIVLMDPPVYLLDEPTSALDSDTERRVMKQFTTLARERKNSYLHHTLTTTSRRNCGRYY